MGELKKLTKILIVEKENLLKGIIEQLDKDIKSMKTEIEVFRLINELKKNGLQK